MGFDLFLFCTTHYNSYIAKEKSFKVLFYRLSMSLVEYFRSNGNPTFRLMVTLLNKGFMASWPPNTSGYFRDRYLKRRSFYISQNNESLCCKLYASIIYHMIYLFDFEVASINCYYYNFDILSTETATNV